jgi:alkylation response protein AidB-like acyl-CoA dehydrogenase
MTTAVDARLVEKATELGPRIAEYGVTGEREHRLPREVIDLLTEAGLFRLLVPASLGGLEADPITCARIIEEVSLFDSAVGWALQAANSGDWYCARLPEEGVQEIYSQKTDTVISLSINPPYAVTPVEGGYQRSGRTPLASNIHDADWLMVLGAMPDGSLRAMFVNAADVTIVDTWDSLGMRGTDSNDVVLDGAFVPATRTWPVAPTFEAGSHSRSPERVMGRGAAGSTTTSS